MKIGQEKRLRGGIKRTRTMWENCAKRSTRKKDYRTARTSQYSASFFCEATTSEVHAVLRHAPADLRGGTLLQHPRVLMATVAYQENPHLCLQILHAARFQVFRGAYILLRVLAVAESQRGTGAS